MFPRLLVRQMGQAADAAINNVLLSGTRPMMIWPKMEVAYVAAVTLGGLYGIAEAWEPICSGRGVTLRLAGVFCHAAPQMRYKGRAGETECELADLLVVTDVRRRSGLLIRRAGSHPSENGSCKVPCFLDRPVESQATGPLSEVVSLRLCGPDLQHEAVLA